MTKHLLVAIGHEISVDRSDDRLLSATSAAGFAEEVVPLITDRSLLLCEGVSYSYLLSPNHKNYDDIKSHIFGDLLGPVLPTLGGFDLRQVHALETFERYEKYHRFAPERLEIESKGHVLPLSVAGVMDAVRAEILTARLSGVPTRDEIELACWTGATSRKFDRMYLDAMHKKGRQHDVCIFVGGAIHVVSMALKSGYPVIDLTRLTDPNKGIAILTGYLIDYVWSKLFKQGS